MNEEKEINTDVAQETSEENKIEWTPAQKAAIALRPRKLLVSAAAGSGKTAVLTQRIIEELTDKESDADISRFLIVTYTRMASAELKSRISEAIRSEASRSPDSKKLAKQLLRLGSAKISTIHSFCADLIKRNFHRLSLPASLKVCEEAQAIEIRTGIMDSLMESAYAGKFSPIPDFRAFSDNFVTTRDTRLADTFLKLYRDIIAIPNGFDIWENAAKRLDSDIPFGQTEWGKTAILALKRRLSFYLPLYRKFRDILAESPAYRKNYIPAIDEDIRLIEELDAMADRGEYHGISARISRFTFEGLTSVGSKNKLPEAEDFKTIVRAPFKDELQKIAKLFASPDPISEDAPTDETDGPLMRDTRRKSAAISLALVAFLREFHRLYSLEKERLGLLDFSDLEQYTYTLLYDKDGSFSALSREVSSEYDEIFVDEFQDINPMQSSIFDALAQNARMFQVGDIKQSIYGFRGAEPDIFAECRRAYDEYKVTAGQTHTCSPCASLTVFLSANFRSSYPVTAFVNRVFDVLFHTPDDYPGGESRIPYSAADRLICSQKGAMIEVPESTPETPDTDVTGAPIAAVVPQSDAPHSEEADSIKEEVSPLELEEQRNRARATKLVPSPTALPVELILVNVRTKKDEPEPVTSEEAEAEAVAARIIELKKSGVPYNKMAVLSRSADNMLPLENKLHRLGISTVNASGEDLADTPEVQLALALLCCVDNPHRDIQLASALRSPVFGVTLDELVRIREYGGKAVSLYTALCLYTEKHEFSKGVRAIEFIDRMRRFASGETADRVLWQIFTETDFFSLIYDGGTVSPSAAAARRANLIKLHTLASDRSTAGSDGIFSFLRRFERLAASKDAPSAAVSADEQSVLFLTFHKSKGLEFDHCFVYGLGHARNQMDKGNDFVSSADLGVSTRLRDSTGIVKYDTPMRQILADRKDYGQFEEELRVLYVALTRPREALYISAHSTDTFKLVADSRESARYCHPTLLLRHRLPIEWVLIALFAELPDSTRFPARFLKLEHIKPYKLDDKGEIEGGVCKRKVSGSDNKNQGPLEYDPLTLDKETRARLTRLTEELKARLSFEYPHFGAEALPAKVSVSRLKPSLLDETDGAEELSALRKGKGEKQTENEKKPTLAVPVFITSTDDEESLRVKISDSESVPTLPVVGTPPAFRPLSPEQRSAPEKAAEGGTATHLFMQFCDFSYVACHGVEAEIERLRDKRFILPYHASLIDRDVLRGFFESELYRDMKDSAHLRREVRFNTRLPAAMFTEDEEYAQILDGETILVQGVIDCYFEDRDGNIVLLDYKTDHFPPEASEAYIISKLRQRHTTQLSYYKLALERLLLRPVYRTLIYSFALGKAIELDIPSFET